MHNLYLYIRVKFISLRLQDLKTRRDVQRIMVTLIRRRETWHFLRITRRSTSLNFFFPLLILMETETWLASRICKKLSVPFPGDKTEEKQRAWSSPHFTKTLRETGNVSFGTHAWEWARLTDIRGVPRCISFSFVRYYCGFINSFLSCSRKRFRVTPGRPEKVSVTAPSQWEPRSLSNRGGKRRFAHVGIIVFSDNRGWSNARTCNRHVRLQQREASRQQRIEWLIRI